jgi:hypothetical protein
MLLGREGHIAVSGGVIKVEIERESELGLFATATVFETVMMFFLFFVHFFPLSYMSLQE